MANETIATGGPKRVSIITPPKMHVDARLDLDYVLWLGTVGPSIIAVSALMGMFGAYMVNAVATISDAFHPPFSVDYIRWMEIIGLFCVLAIAVHYVRLRRVALINAIQSFMLPDPLVATSLGSDNIMKKFECTAKVSIEFYDVELKDIIERRGDQVRLKLEEGLAVAITDPVTRFSKTRMEHTLRLSLGEVLGLSNIASVTLHDLRQRRAKAPVPNKNASPRPDDAIDDLRAAQSAHAEVAPKPADGAKPPPC